MYRIQCLNPADAVVAVAEEVSGSLVIQGDMRAWGETAAELLPIIREAAAAHEAALRQAQGPRTLNWFGCRF